MAESPGGGPHGPETTGGGARGGEDLFVAVGHALTGCDLAPAAGSRTPDGGSRTRDETVDAGAVVVWLAEAGWDATRLQAHRALCQLGRRPWPHPVPDGLVHGWGQFGSLLRQVRQDLGLDGLHQQVRHGPRVLGPAELRLLADKPPHHG